MINQCDNVPKFPLGNRPDLQQFHKKATTTSITSVLMAVFQVHLCYHFSGHFLHPLVLENFDRLYTGQKLLLSTRQCTLLPLHCQQKNWKASKKEEIEYIQRFS